MPSWYFLLEFVLWFSITRFTSKQKITPCLVVNFLQCLSSARNRVWRKWNITSWTPMNNEKFILQVPVTKSVRVSHITWKFLVLIMSNKYYLPIIIELCERMRLSWNKSILTNSELWSCPKNGNGNDMGTSPELPSSLGVTTLSPSLSPKG